MTGRRPGVSQYETLAAVGWVRRPQLDTPGTHAWALPDGRVWIGLVGTIPDPEVPSHPPYGVGDVSPWRAGDTLDSARQVVRTLDKTV
jgi:hypothetical protein